MADFMELYPPALINGTEPRSVLAALQHPWSNGPVEGHVHRLKLIKRSVYGRANFDLLRLRVVSAA